MEKINGYELRETREQETARERKYKEGGREENVMDTVIAKGGTYRCLLTPTALNNIV